MGVATEPPNSTGLPYLVSNPPPQKWIWEDFGEESTEGSLSTVGSLSRGRGNCIATKAHSSPKLSIMCATAAPEAKRKQRRREAGCPLNSPSTKGSIRSDNTSSLVTHIQMRKINRVSLLYIIACSLFSWGARITVILSLTDEPVYETNRRTEQTCGCQAEGGEEGLDWECGISGCEPLYVTQGTIFSVLR